MTYLERYLKKTNKDKNISSPNTSNNSKNISFNVSKLNSGAISFLAALDGIEKVSPLVVEKIIQELKDQRTFLKLIASENYSSLAVQQAMGNLLTDKYAEGISKRRFYAGCDNVDAIETYASEKAKELFQAEHAYVQPHSGADANMIAYWSILVGKIQSKELEVLGKKTLNQLTDEEYETIRQKLVNQKLMGMGLGSGGHLTHGYRLNMSSKMMKSVAYDVDPKTGLLDYKAIETLAKKEKPLIFVAGYSAYPRLIDCAILKEIADSVGAVFMVDMAHFAGLVAGGVIQGNYNPVPFADIITSTTHKTLRGPRGGLILCKKEYQEVVNKGCPLVMGGPMPHVMAAKAVAFDEALKPDFKKYAERIVTNAKALAETFVKEKVAVLTGGTDNHLVLLDVFKSFNLTGREAEMALRQARLTVNRNSIPNDQNGAWQTSGIRIGTPAMTTLGMGVEEMQKIAKIMISVLKNTKADKEKKQVMVEKAVLEKSIQEVQELLVDFPLYPELVI